MKKKVLMIAVFAASFAVNAQEKETSVADTTMAGPIVAEAAVEEKKPSNFVNDEVLPKKGEWALGFDAAALIRTVGGVFYDNNGSDGVNQKFSQQITGKYFLTDESAVRVRLGINTARWETQYEVEDSKAVYDASFGTQEDQDMVESTYNLYDTWTENENSFYVSLGYEVRRGKGRIQGYYGADVSFGSYTYNQTMEYGNEFSDLYEIDTEDYGMIGGNNDAKRYLESKESNLTIGARGFIGVEFFFAKKMSLGLEYGLGYYWNINNNAWGENPTETYEAYYASSTSGPANVVIEEAVNEIPKNIQNGALTDNSGYNNGINDNGVNDTWNDSYTVTLNIHF